MDCQQVTRDEIAEKYLRGRLEEEEQNDFETHLLECVRCTQAVEALQSTREVLVAQAQEIRKQSGGLTPAPVKVPWWKKRAFAYAMVLVCVLGLGRITLYRRLGHEHSTAQQVQQTPPPAFAAGAQSSLSGQPEPQVGANGPAKQVNEFATDQHLAVQVQAPPVAEKAVPVATAPEQNANSNPEAVRPVQPESTAPGGEATATDKLPATQPVPPIQASTVNEDDEKDLFVLGTVSPPPYTFAGQATTAAGPFSVTKPKPGTSLTTGATQAGNAGTLKPSQAAFQNAMGAYIEGRYSDAAELLQDAVRQDPKASDANFFLGVCRLTLGHPEESIAPFRAALQDEKSLYTQAAHFYLAKAYVQTRDLESAEGQLSVAASLPGRWKSEAASELPRVRAIRLKRSTR